MLLLLFSTDEKPYICSLCDFVTTESQAYLTHVRVQHPVAHDNRPSPIPSPSSTSDRATPSGYPKLKKALLQGINNSASPPAYLSAQSSPLHPSMAPMDLCVRPEGHRGLVSFALDRKGLLSHKCSFCSHTTRYPEVLWMHQTVAHRINSSSSNLAPKWALKNRSKGSKDSLSSRRRTGPPPILEGKECPPLPPLIRTQRTRPPTSSSENLKRNKPGGHASTPSSSSSPSSSFSRGSSLTTGSQAGRPPVRPGSSTSSSNRHMEDHGHTSRFRPKVDIYPRGGSLSSSSSLEKSTSAPSRSSAPSPSSAAVTRMTDRYVMPQEGLGFMLSSKHGLAEYSRARGSTHQPTSNSHSQGQANATRPSTITHSSAAAHGYGASQTHGATLQQNSSSPSISSSSSTLSSEARAEVKQEAMAETPEMPMDILSFLKNYSPHELAALYHRWGAANALLDPTGKDYSCFYHCVM